LSQPLLLSWAPAVGGTYYCPGHLLLSGASCCPERKNCEKRKKQEKTTIDKGSKKRKTTINVPVLTMKEKKKNNQLV